jgi:hypothetical protein
MEQSVIISRHIVLIHERIPVYGVLVISGEEIKDLIRVFEDTPVQDLVD